MISIVVPCYNESGNIEAFVKEVQAHLSPTGQPYEIIFVDDGSLDGTLQKIKSLPTEANARFIAFSRNFGHQLALKAGLDHAQGDAVITMDGDLQHPPRVIPALLAEWQAGFPIVNTVRRSTEQAGFFKRRTSQLFYWVYEKVSGMPLVPGSADFRLLDKQVVEALRRFKEPHLFLRGLIYWIGFKTSIVEYDADQRFAGETKYSVGKMIHFALDGIMAFSIKPLRVTGFIGMLISLFSALFIVYDLFIVFFTHRAITGWASILVSVLFLGGIQMIFLGLLGEYIGKIFIESKQRPQYLIKEKSF